MNDAYFENVTGIGKLYLEYTFFEFENEPILFLCGDQNKKLYICICSDIRYGQKWIITECKITTLKLLINEEIDIVSAFLRPKKAVIVNMDLQGNESNFEIEVDKIDKLDLPKEGTYIRCNKEDAYNYLWKKELEISMVQSYMTMEDSAVIHKNNETHDGLLNATLKINEIDSVLKEKMPIKYKYSISENEKYIENFDDLSVNVTGTCSYLDAA